MAQGILKIDKSNIAQHSWFANRAASVGMRLALFLSKTCQLKKNLSVNILMKLGHLIWHKKSGKHLPTGPDYLDMVGGGGGLKDGKAQLTVLTSVD